jgi:hypothetical protein
MDTGRLKRPAFQPLSPSVRQPSRDRQPGVGLLSSICYFTCRRLAVVQAHQQHPREVVMYRRRAVAFAVTLIAGLLSGASQASAAERTLEFQLVYRIMESKKIEVPNVEGQSISQSTVFGVAVFKDGRTAVKDFVAVTDRSKDSMSQFGYSTYTFDDGSTLTLSWKAGSRPGQPYQGEYKVLSGTGAYAGATGSGTFGSAPSKFKDAPVLNVKLLVKTP